MKSSVKKWKGKTSREIQDEIFRTMPAGKKLKLASGLTVLCQKLHNLNENSKDLMHNNLSTANSKFWL